jgi:lysophospholipase L1-like esterase
MKRALSAAIAASLALAGAAPHALAQDAPPSLAGARMVALGSSFAAGSGDAPIKPDTPKRCGRSWENYATLLAEQLRMVLVDATCGGATSAHVLGPWNELPAQVEAITADTRLVTITVGGNDIGYVGYLLAESCKVRGPILLGGADAVCPVVPVPGPEAYARLLRDLRSIATQASSRAPGARLVFVQYLPMVPKRACGEVPISAAAARTAREIAKQLAAVTTQVARETGSVLYDAGEAASPHLPCGTGEPWVVGWPAAYKPGDTFPWHPTRAGHAAIARTLAARLGTR